MGRILDPWMAAGARVDETLRGQTHDPARRTHFGHFFAILIAAGVCYGAVMGTFGGLRIAQIACSAAKLPLLLLSTFGLTLPSFFVLNTLLGLRADFGRTVIKLGAGQATLTIVLASLSPLTALWYVSVPDYHDAILLNAGMFAIASFSAQWALRRSYRELILRNRRHGWMLRAWLVIYSFVGIQMGWVLRPFVGDPALPTTFFRKNAFTNAYTFVAHLLAEKLR
jgi:hypothetical protein